MFRCSLIGFILSPPLFPRRKAILKGHHGIFLSTRAWHKAKDRDLYGRKSKLKPMGVLKVTHG